MLCDKQTSSAGTNYSQSWTPWSIAQNKHSCSQKSCWKSRNYLMCDKWTCGHAVPCWSQGDAFINMFIYTHTHTFSFLQSGWASLFIHYCSPDLSFHRQITFLPPVFLTHNNTLNISSIRDCLLLFENLLTYCGRNYPNTAGATW